MRLTRAGACHQNERHELPETYQRKLARRRGPTLRHDLGRAAAFEDQTDAPVLDEHRFVDW